MDKISSVCVIDDDDTFRFLTNIVIEKTKLAEESKIFSNGLEALNFLKSITDHKELPQLILLDLNMPTMDGWEFLEEFKQLDESIKSKITIYVVSSSISPIDIEKAKSMDVIKDYLLKPVTKEKFAELVNELSNRNSSK